LLLAAPGIDVKQASNDDWTPLYWAVWYGHAELVRWLLAVEGIDVNHLDKDGRTPLYIASGMGNVRIVSLLLHAGADPYLANNDGRRPIDVARGLSKRILERWLRSRERILANRLTVLPEAVIRDKIHPQIGHYHQYVNE
jgi:ankyrin repeat protein